MRFLTLITFLAVGFAMPLRGADAEAVTKEFFESIVKGDKEAAMARLKVFPELPADYLPEKIDRFIELAKTKGFGPTVITSIEGKGMAVVIIKDVDRLSSGAIDYDPVYLLREDNAWKVTINVRFDETKKISVSEDQKAEYKKLKEWYSARKEKLKKKNGPPAKTEDEQAETPDR